MPLDNVTTHQGNRPTRKSPENLLKGTRCGHAQPPRVPVTNQVEASDFSRPLLLFAPPQEAMPARGDQASVPATASRHVAIFNAITPAAIQPAQSNQVRQRAEPGLAMAVASDTGGGGICSAWQIKGTR